MNSKQKNSLIKYFVQEQDIYNFYDLALKSYMLLFHDIPHIISREVYAISKLTHEIKSKFDLEEIIKKQDYYHASAYNKTENILIDYKNYIVLDIEKHGSLIVYSKNKTPENILNKYQKIFIRHAPKRRKVKSKGRIFVLTEVGGGKNEKLTFAPFKIKKVQISVEQNYNDDFKPKSHEIIKSLNIANNNGIVILHGIPGVGKTFYLKHLINILKKKILYIPPALIQHIVSPFFIRLLGKFKNSVLIIEDADNILRKRDEKSDIQDVSSLLNITDGLLHDVLDLQIVATFNTDIRNIDEAFLRKGRLIAIHKFQKLTIEKSQKLSDELGFKTIIDEPMTLADIYNQDKNVFDENRKGTLIGFKR